MLRLHAGEHGQDAHGLPVGGSRSMLAVRPVLSEERNDPTDKPWAFGWATAPTAVVAKNVTIPRASRGHCSGSTPDRRRCRRTTKITRLRPSDLPSGNARSATRVHFFVIGEFNVLVGRSRRGLCQGGPSVWPIFESNEQPSHPQGLPRLHPCCVADCRRSSQATPRDGSILMIACEIPDRKGPRLDLPERRHFPVRQPVLIQVSRLLPRSCPSTLIPDRTTRHPSMYEQG